MTAVRTAGTSPKTVESLTKKAAALWHWLNCTEEAPDNGFDDTYCTCRFLQALLNRLLDSALKRLLSPSAAAANNATPCSDPTPAVDSRCRKKAPNAFRSSASCI